jgi:hypothetical protein
MPEMPTEEIEIPIEVLDFEIEGLTQQEAETAIHIAAAQANAIGACRYDFPPTSLAASSD